MEQGTTSKIEKDGLTQKEGPGTASSSPGPVKRKAANLTPKNKRLRMENEESMELKITWEEAQELLRPPPKAPNIVIVDGHEFEEYEVWHSFQHLSSLKLPSQTEICSVNIYFQRLYLHAALVLLFIRTVY